MQHPQGGERENKPADAVAKPDTISVTPVTKNKQRKWKSVCLVRDKEASPKREQSQEQEEEETEINDTEATQSVSLSELQDMRKDCSHQPGELILSWLLLCGDIGTSSQELEGREAQQLGSLVTDKAMDKGIGKKAGILSLWQRLLSSVKDRHPFKKELENSRSKWTNIKGGILYLRQLAVLEAIYNDQSSKDPEEI